MATQCWVAISVFRDILKEGRWPTRHVASVLAQMMSSAARAIDVRTDPVVVPEIVRAALQVARIGQARQGRVVQTTIVRARLAQTTPSAAARAVTGKNALPAGRRDGPARMTVNAPVVTAQIVRAVMAAIVRIAPAVGRATMIVPPGETGRTVREIGRRIRAASARPGAPHPLAVPVENAILVRTTAVSVGLGSAVRGLRAPRTDRAAIAVHPHGVATAAAWAARLRAAGTAVRRIVGRIAAATEAGPIVAEIVVGTAARTIVRRIAAVTVRLNATPRVADIAAEYAARRIVERIAANIAVRTGVLIGVRSAEATGGKGHPIVVPRARRRTPALTALSSRSFPRTSPDVTSTAAPATS